MIPPANQPKDFLGLQLRDMPYFRAVLRAVECRFYQDYTLEAPALDVGCGDGHFATIAFDHPLDAGIDPWTGPVHEAGRRGAYRLVVQSYGDRLPFEDGHFSSAVSNSVLEHIPGVDAVVCEISRVLKPGSLFLFCVPNQNFLANLRSPVFSTGSACAAWGMIIGLFLTGFLATSIATAPRSGRRVWHLPASKLKNGGIIFRRRRFIY